jgi:FAD binding domain-containing protein
MNRSYSDVLIVGSCLGGLTLANDLAVRGIPFRVIEPLPEPVCESRAHGFGARTVWPSTNSGWSSLCSPSQNNPHRSFASISAAGWSESWTWPQRLATRAP